jgi:hypothetical protein
MLEHMLWSVPEERAAVEEIVTAVAAPKLHAALQIAHQADDVHAKALQTWFHPDEERAAIAEAETKLQRLGRRLEEICTGGAEDGIAPRLRQLHGRLASHLGEIEVRKQQLAGDTGRPASEAGSSHAGARSGRGV